MVATVSTLESLIWALTVVCVLLLLPRAFLALGWLLELRPHDTILSTGDGQKNQGKTALPRQHILLLFCGCSIPGTDILDWVMQYTSTTPVE